MKPFFPLLAGLLLVSTTALAADPPMHSHVALLRGAVQAGNTLYISGALDINHKTGKVGANAEESSRLALDNFKKEVLDAGFTMNDVVQVQVFASDLSYFPTFNKIYATYFPGPKPARAFLGVAHLLRDGHFEIMGIAVKGHQ